MANILFLDGLWTDVATMSASAEVFASPASNLLLPRPTDAYRSPDQVFTVNFVMQGPSTGVDAIFMGFWNITAAGVFSIRTATTEANITNAPSYVSAGNPFWKESGLGSFYNSFHSWHIFPTRRTETWIRVQISDISNPEGFISGGVIRIGQIWRPQRPVSFGGTYGFHDPSERYRSYGGGQSIRYLPGWGEGRLPFNFASRQDRNDFILRHRRFGLHPFWIHQNSDNTVDGYIDQLYATIDVDMPTHQHYDTWRVNVALHEMT